jgi:hypothetical protein
MTPRGIRNNNPGNIELGRDQWQGLAPEQSDGRFAQFQSPEYGIRAMGKTLKTYQDKYGLTTPEQMISRWAPPNENDTNAYIQSVAKQAGIDPKKPIDLSKDGSKLMVAMIQHENGIQPYDESTIERGLSMALGGEKVAASGQTQTGVSIEDVRAAIERKKAAQKEQGAQPGVSIEDVKAAIERKRSSVNKVGQSEYADMSGKDVALKAAKNLPDSIVRELVQVWDAVTNPEETLNAFKELGGGILRNIARIGSKVDYNPNLPNYDELTANRLSPEEAADKIYSDDDASSDQALQSVRKFYVDRYGSKEGFKKAVAEEPASVLSDLSVALSGGASLGAKAGGTVGNIAKGVGKVAENLDVVNLLGNTVARAIKPANLSDSVKLLRSEGVKLSPGQMFDRGFFRKGEEGFSSIPIVGDVVGQSYRKSIEEFNKAAYNRVLKSLGLDIDAVKIGDVGPSAIDKLSDTLSNEYEKVLPYLKLEVTSDLVGELENTVRSASQVMSEQDAVKLGKIYDRVLGDKLYQIDKLDGKAIKQIQTDIRLQKDKFKKSTASGDVAIYDALDDIESSLRRKLINDNPTLSKKLKKIDEGYANYVILRKAGASANQTDGFTPAQLMQSIRSLDRSVGKGDVARGRALMQDLAMAAEDVLPSKLPDSGTATRGLMAALVGGGAGLSVGTVTASLVAIGLSPYYARTLANGIIARDQKYLAALRNILKNVPKATGPAISEAAQTKETIENNQ